MTICMMTGEFVLAIGIGVRLSNQILSNVLIFIGIALFLVPMILTPIFIRIYELEKSQYDTILAKIPISPNLHDFAGFQLIPDSQILLLPKEINENSLAFTKILDSEKNDRELTVTLTDLFKEYESGVEILRKESNFADNVYYVPIVSEIILGQDEKQDSKHIKHLILACPSAFKDTFNFQPTKIWDSEIQSNLTLRVSLCNLQLVKMLTPYCAFCIVQNDKPYEYKPEELNNSMIAALSLFNSMLQTSQESVGIALVNLDKENERLKNENDKIVCERIEYFIKNGFIQKAVDYEPTSGIWAITLIIGVFIGLALGVWLV